MAGKNKSEYVCTQCDYRTTKWFGKCPSCGEWNCMEEVKTVSAPVKGSLKNKAASSLNHTPKSEPINKVTLPSQTRTVTGIREFDRVMGGGIVDGSVTLISGEPGIGKSTLLLQVCGCLSEGKKLLYVSGEESMGQLKMRAERLGVANENLLVLSETEISEIVPEIETVSPDIVVIDSIQTMYDSEASSSAGSVTQVKNCASAFMRIAKSSGIAVLIVGHVNKDGGIAGPKVLEHMVDTVLYFEGDKQYAYRILRAVKNRFGSTNEIGMFEMEEEGLVEVENPSEHMLSQRPIGVSGGCALCVIEGTRPILSEIQALVTQTSYPVPRRMNTGFDYNRMALITAVLEKRLGLNLGTQDIYLNVAGGLRLVEPSSDLPAALAIISSFKDIAISEKTVAIGELGLAGECRSVSGIETRVKEAIRLGFDTILIPYHNYEKLHSSLKNRKGVRIMPVRSVFDALKLFSERKNERNDDEK